MSQALDEIIETVVQRQKAPSPARARALREEKGVSRAAVAKVIGVTPTAVLFWETGRSQPTAAHLGGWLAILHALEMA